MTYKDIKFRTYQILEKGQEGDKWSKRADLIIVWLILLNILAVILESVAWLRNDFAHQFEIFEHVSIGIFIVEYLLRLWSITSSEEYSSSILGRLKYVFSFHSIIDLMSIIPAFLPFFFKMDARIIRSVRLMRLFRILKLARYNKAFGHIRTVIKTNREELLISLGAVGLLLVVASCLMYFLEHDDQPEIFSSIPATMWWGVATLTTVGYGDVYPITDLGKLVGGLMAVLGVGLFALPAGILANGFSQVIEDKKEEKEQRQQQGIKEQKGEYCSHCGSHLAKHKH